MHDADKIPDAACLLKYKAKALPVHPTILGIETGKVEFHKRGAGISCNDIVRCISSPYNDIVTDEIGIGKVHIINKFVKIILRR